MSEEEIIERYSKHLSQKELERIKKLSNQLMMDELLFGHSAYKVNPDGTQERIEPTSEQMMELLDRLHKEDE